MGVAFPSDTGGTYITVFSHRVNLLAQTHHASPGPILGHVIAHEIGHLLLGPTRPNPTGIMREPWTAEEVQRLSQGTLLFSREDAAEMRRELKRRSQGSGGSARGPQSPNGACGLPPGFDLQASR